MQFGQIHIEFRTGIVFSVIALVLSLLTGFIMGISVGTVVLRGVVTAAVFFCVGYGIILVLKKYVPEVYEAITAAAVKEPGEINGETVYGDYVVPEESHVDVNEAEPEFKEFTEKDYEKYNTTGDMGLESTLDTSQGKMGKHIVVQQQFNNYEPKIMAQAIRTMMSKDKD